MSIKKRMDVQKVGWTYRGSRTSRTESDVLIVATTRGKLESVMPSEMSRCEGHVWSHVRECLGRAG